MNISMSYQQSDTNNFYAALEEDTIHTADEKRSRLRSLAPVLLVSCLLSVVFLYSAQTISGSDAKGLLQLIAGSSPFTSSKTVESNPVFISLQREGYSPLPYFLQGASQITKYSFLSRMVAVIEPSVPMNLYVSEFSSDSTYISYSICEKDSKGQDTTACVSGNLSNPSSTSSVETSSIQLSCNPFTTYGLTALEIEIDSSKVINTLSGNAVCMYVRRELRELTQDDLSRTMDAMATLWNIDENKGRALFGENYHNAAFFAEAHHFNAALSEGDHIHEGLGFFPQHLKLTNMFELAMQSVDPGVSLPYWDFTIEGANGQSIFESSVFTADTFGTLIEPTDKDMGWTYTHEYIEDGRIRDGRWANITVHYSRFEELSFNYGFLRAPWNSNPSPYVSRYPGYTTSLPQCGQFSSWLQQESFTDFLKYSPYAPHASVHGAIGSVYGCDLLTPLTQAGIIIDTDEQIALCQKWGFIMKEMYRKNRLSMRSDCSYESSAEDGHIVSMKCGYECNNEDGSFDRILAEAIGTKHTGDLTTDQKASLASFVCEGDGFKILLGDQIESASPADPSFWPIHPTLERTVQAKFMSSGFPDTTWPTDAKNDYVCDKSNCYIDGVQDYHDECCYGHYEFDQMLDFVKGDRASGYGQTNREMLDGTDPTNTEYSMPYIYAHFEWDHCDLDFQDLLSRLSSI